jgi:hypothetical protein
MAEDVNKAIKAFREGKSIRHAAELLEVPPTCLRCTITVDGITTKSKGGQTVFTPSNKNCSAL